MQNPVTDTKMRFIKKGRNQTNTRSNTITLENKFSFLQTETGKTISYLIKCSSPIHTYDSPSGIYASSSINPRMQFILLLLGLQSVDFGTLNLHIQCAMVPEGNTEQRTLTKRISCF